KGRSVRTQPKPWRLLSWTRNRFIARRRYRSFVLATPRFGGVCWGPIKPSWERHVLDRAAVAAPKTLTTSENHLMSPVSNKIALFIDGANLYATAKTLGFDIDYKRLLKEFQSRGTLLRAFYYTAIIEDQEYSSIRPLIDWLDYNGYTVVTKATKEFIDASGRRKVKGNMDIELAVDAMELAEHVDQIVLFSGDGHFRSLVDFRLSARARQPDWFNAPVPSFGSPDAALLIVGLAPGLQGANRTGRPFTGDYAGDLLYATLIKYGFAEGHYQARPDDGLTLVDCRISNAVRCVPPQNKPL